MCILKRGWQKKSLKHLKSRGSKSNLKNFLESVYSNLKKSYKLLLDTSFLLKTFQGISRETCCGKIFLDFNFLNSMCNEIEGNIDLRTCSSILGILEKPVIPRSNQVLERQNNTFLTQKRYDTRIGVTLWNSNTNS